MLLKYCWECFNLFYRVLFYVFEYQACYLAKTILFKAASWKVFLKDKNGIKTISFNGLSIWNSLLDSIKKSNSLNTFKYNVKKHYLTWITHNVYMWRCVSIFVYVSMSVCVYIFIWIYLWMIYMDVHVYILVCFSLTYLFS